MNGELFRPTIHRSQTIATDGRWMDAVAYVLDGYLLRLEESPWMYTGIDCSSED